LKTKDFIEFVETIEIIDKKDKKIEKILVALVEINSADMDLYLKLYFKGYLWYLMPDENSERDFNIEFNLLKSIELNDNYIHSKIQLSYFYFDKKKYSKVTELLGELDISIFQENDQLWKSIKFQELLLVSKLNLSKEIDQVLISEFSGLVSIYSNISSDELSVPIELVESIIINSGKNNIETLAFLCLGMINSKNQRQFFDSEIRQNLSKIISGNGTN